jgi:hypothetical protein
MSNQRPNKKDPLKYKRSIARNHLLIILVRDLDKSMDCPLPLGTKEDYWATVLSGVALPFPIQYRRIILVWEFALSVGETNI